MKCMVWKKQSERTALCRRGSYREEERGREEAEKVAPRGKEGTACTLPSSAPRRGRFAQSLASLPGGPQVQGRASLWSSREMTAPCRWLAPKRDRRGTESFKFNERQIPPTRQEEGKDRERQEPLSCQGMWGVGRKHHL